MAAQIGLKAVGEPHFDRPAGFTVVDSTTMLSGCTVNVLSAQVYFNEKSDSSWDNPGYYKLICNTRQGTADYTGDTGRLCPRNRLQKIGVDADNCDTYYDYGSPMTDKLYMWSEEVCHQEVQVNVDGRVSVVDASSKYDDTVAWGLHGTEYSRTAVNSLNYFRVRWADGHFPTAAAGCAAFPDCRIVIGDEGETCVCKITEVTATVFRNATDVPTQAEVESQLFIGSPPPRRFDAGNYTLCSTLACNERMPSVLVYTQGTASDPLFDETAIFEITVNRTASGGRTLYFSNKVSTITIANSTAAEAFSFRNPPHLVSLVDTSTRDAQYETEALLDHLVYHQNTAPFIGHRLIQPMVTSNPSPRYAAAVSAAFCTGQYGGHLFSGQYADLGAAVAAVLLDREARSLIVAADPTHGQLRAPILRLLHFLRAMELWPRGGRYPDTYGLQGKIGQEIYSSPGVFSFFNPEFTPEGPVLEAGLVAPEAQLLTLPYVIGFMDGIASLTFQGLDSCQGGFNKPWCNSYNVGPVPWSTEIDNTGYLVFTPTSIVAGDVVDELDVLLSAGHLDSYSRAILVEEYSFEFNASRCPNDRTNELSGRLVPWTYLYPGDSLFNTRGEQLCFSFDGVARHIDTNGSEIYNTAYETRKAGTYMAYHPAGYLWIASATVFIKWSSDRYRPGQYKVFHSFLHGPCKAQNAQWFELMALGLTVPDAPQTHMTCTAEAASSASPLVPQLAAFEKLRERADAQYALRVVQNLFASSAAFASTNDAATSDVLEYTPPAANATRTRPYKALVVLFLAGGADTFNMIVPYSNCDARNVSTQYTLTRAGAGLSMSTVLPITVPANPRGVLQPCGTFALHNKYPYLQQLFDERNASFLANVGALMEPASKVEYFDNLRQFPPNLFAHNTQSLGAHTVNPEDAVGASGVLGRILTALHKQVEGTSQVPLKTAAYSVSPSRTAFRGSPVEPILLDAFRGIITYGGSTTSDSGDEKARTIATLNRLTGNRAGSVFAQTHNRAVRYSLRDSEAISERLTAVSLTQDWSAADRSVPVGYGYVVRQFEQAAKIIKERFNFGAERDVIYLEMGNFDSHKDLLSTSESSFQTINTALETFVKEMKDDNIWDQVTVQTYSEFGRTMTTNGQGTDHAWGGNQFVVGGRVNGGHILGEYPEPRVDGPNSISSTGAMLPTSPWESMWQPLAQWFGVNDDQMPNVFPNYYRFPANQLLTISDVFASGADDRQA